MYFCLVMEGLSNDTLFTKKPKKVRKFVAMRGKRRVQSDENSKHKRPTGELDWSREDKVSGDTD